MKWMAAHSGGTVGACCLQVSDSEERFAVPVLVMLARVFSGRRLASSLSAASIVAAATRFGLRFVMMPGFV